jgi:mono/diheme cytochrome c family protein
MSDPRGEQRLDPALAWAARSVNRWRRAAAYSSLLMLLVLAWAPTKYFLQQWRRVQMDYNDRLSMLGAAPSPLRIRQIWLPVAGKADRCGTCHLGMAGEKPVPGYALFAAHPPVPHPPEEFGCTYCHSGQGWATNEVDAHGLDGSWPHPIHERKHVEAGCGACHSGLVLPLPEEVEEADDLVSEYGCAKCHREGARAGETGAEDLEGIAIRGIPDDWLARHQGLTVPDEETTPLSELDEYEDNVLEAWLRTLVGAPHLARGKMVFHQLGCLGCHRRGRLGGDVGPDISAIGDKDARSLDPAGRSDPSTLPRWLREHLLDPRSTVQESRMPALDTEEIERESDLDDLITYLLSLQGEDLPRELTPRDRANLIFGLGRDVPDSGRGLFVTFCSACHGSQGEGRELPTLGVVSPMIGTRGYQAMVSPRYLRDSMLRGRRGRFMPAWGVEDGGLSESDIARIVEYLRGKGFPIRPFEALSGPADPQHGREVFNRRCAVCHRSEPGEPGFGEDLLESGVLHFFRPETLYQATLRGWVEEGMPAFAFLRRNDVRDLLAFLAPALADGADLPEITADGAHSHFGSRVWAAKCAECHGDEGEGGEGPLLNSGPYLRWADDPYLAVRIDGHRGARARSLIGSLSEDDLEALLDHMRNWSGLARPPRPAPADARIVARGAALYAKHCVECHGENGAGKVGPSHASPDFADIVSKPFLIMTILEGRKGTAMPAWGHAKENRIAPREAAAIADYIFSLSEPGAAPLQERTLEPQQGREGTRKQ